MSNACRVSRGITLVDTAIRYLVRTIGTLVAAQPWKICMAHSESHDLLVAGDTLGNLFSWKVSDVRVFNTDGGDGPPHNVFGAAAFKTKR